MKTIKLTDDEFMKLQHIATVLRLRGLNGHELLENITAQKRYSLVLSRTVTQTAEVTFAAQDDKDAEAKVEAFKAEADQLHWERYDVPGAPRTVMVSEIMPKVTPDPVPELKVPVFDELLPVDRLAINAYLGAAMEALGNDDKPVPEYWPKLRETWEVVNPDEGTPENERKGVVIGVSYCPNDGHLSVALLRPDGTEFDWYALDLDFDYANVSPDWHHEYYRKVTDAP